MEHPEELFAELVDGTLEGPVHSDVQAHLGTCARCRSEVEAAVGARRALDSLPQAAMPPGLLDGVLAEAERNASGPQVVPMRKVRAPGVPAWYRWAGVAGVAAAAVLVAVVALPNLRGRDAAIMAESGDAHAPTTAAADQLEVQDTDYDEAAIQELIAPLTRSTTLPTAEMNPETVAGGDAQYTDAAKAGEAEACLQTAFTSLEGEPLIQGQRVRLISATFKGEPAYIGIYLVGPGAGEPGDRIAVWVAAAQDCSVLSVTQATI